MASRGSASFVELDRMSLSYDLLERQVRELLSGESDYIANAANFASFVYHELPDVNWAGFYFLDAAGDLVLGPFAGRPACTRLAKGRGVCGAAAIARETVVVDDVTTFTDHIACDAASRSEIVVPLFTREEVYGVFDIDSPSPARFSPRDRSGIERLVRAFIEAVPHPHRAVSPAP
jgi:GAF domain-containing protein